MISLPRLFIIISITGLIIAAYLSETVAAEVQFGPACKCHCISPACEFPKTLAECKLCVPSLASSFAEGKCWKNAGAKSEGDCATQCSRSLVGCSGYAGWIRYTLGSACWCVFKKP